MAPRAFLLGWAFPRTPFCSTSALKGPHRNESVQFEALDVMFLSTTKYWAAMNGGKSWMGTAILFVKGSACRESELKKADTVKECYMVEKRHNWQVVVYEADSHRVVSHWHIVDRTEQHAHQEAEEQIAQRYANVDWRLLTVRFHSLSRTS